MSIGYMIINVFLACFLLDVQSKSKRLIIGTNKYSHDASICIVDALDGKVLFSQAKERITGRKHDGGAIGGLVEYGLKYLSADLSDVHTVVSNNHHFRVHPFEKRIPWSQRLNHIPKDYADISNLIPSAKHLELSHHLAHAWSVVGTAPFDRGLVVVMDGMGESYRAMREDMTGIEDAGDYMHDLKLLKAYGGEGFVGVPQILNPSSAYREAESAYVFDGTSLRPVFKRWTRERSPSELYNHGFENMESLGAVYSRVSSHLLGDWNACGKVMGLASWSSKHTLDAESWVFGSDSRPNLGRDFYHKYKIMQGNPFVEGDFSINWDVLEGLPDAGEFKADTFGRSAVIASSVQNDLEKCSLDLISSLKAQTLESNLALAGGVALNSVMNGRIMKESGFDQVFIPPAPGDEGVAVGCAMYGLQRYREEHEFETAEGSLKGATLIKRLVFSAYQGADFSDQEIAEAVSDYSGWVRVQRFSADSDDLVEDASDVLAGGGVIAWFQGRSEFGQRALGSRSILSDPRTEAIRRVVNDKVKEREWWRPLAPSVLEESAREWFDLTACDASPYMSVTSQVKEEHRDKVPAVCHIDGTARLQTVSQSDNPLYHKLISAFARKSKVPMVLNTSFNRKSQPIVETPSQAVATLLATRGAISALYIGSFKVTRRDFPRQDVLAAEGSEVPIYAVPIYITETTYSMQQPEEPIRIRVQDGALSDSPSDWRSLPSMLHLEVLQSLQSLPGEDGADGEYSETTVGDVHAAFTSVEMGDGGADWGGVVDALEWLFENNYVYFETAEDDIDPADALKGLADIVDMR